MKRLLRGLGPNVIALGFTSFFTDCASEMVFPLMPAFLIGTLKSSEAVLGLVEGAAGSLSSLLRIVSGWMSDRFRRRKPFIFAGYGIAAVARPFFGLAQSAFHVLSIRLVDRFGKGLRLAARDALITDSCDPGARGKAFGFQQMMDNLGATAGPLIAFALLARGMEIRSIFLVTAVPAAMVMLVIAAFVRDRPSAATAPQPLRLTLKPFDGRFRRFLVIVTLFTLGNSSDIFLLRRAGELGVGVGLIPLVWAGLNFVRMLASLPAGIAADRMGRKGVVVAGWIVYAACYAGFAFADSWPLFLVVMGVYGLHMALGEGAARALVADLVPDDLRGTAFGLYHFCMGLALLPASLGAGWIYKTWGAMPAFLPGAFFASVAAVLMATLNVERRVTSAA